MFPWVIIRRNKHPNIIFLEKRHRNRRSPLSSSPTTTSTHRHRHHQQQQWVEDDAPHEEEQQEEEQEEEVVRLTIDVDAGGAPGQTILGFGGAFTDAAGIVWLTLSERTRAQLVTAYFHPTEGIMCIFLLKYTLTKKN